MCNTNFISRTRILHLHISTKLLAVGVTTDEVTKLLAPARKTLTSE